MPDCECGRIAERNGRCATCNFEARKAERQAGKEKKPIRKIKPVSDKRATQNAQYLKLRKHTWRPTHAVRYANATKKAQKYITRQGAKVSDYWIQTTF